MKTIKQLLMTVVVLLCSVTASAYDFTVDGIYYKITSAADLTVSVTSGDNKYSGNVTIPTTVSYKSRNLTVTSIGESAFSGCSGLTSVTIGNSVTSIGNWAFYNCTSLKKLNIEDGETTLSLGCNDYELGYTGEGLFYDCPLESLYLGRNIQYETGKNYGYSPFYGKTKLKSVTIGNSVTSIGERAFYGCSGLTSVTIGNSVTSIGDYAFSGCSGLASITIPNSVTSIGDYAFEDCTSLKDLRIENGETTLSLGCNSYTEEGLFYDCPLESLYLGRNIQYKTGYNYGYSPFCRKTKLKSVTIGNSVTSIGSSAFKYCSGLTSITIGNSVTSIGESAFSGCSGLTSVTIPNSVTSIGNGAFYNCTSLKKLNIEDGETTLSLGYNSSSDWDTGEGLFYDCPLESLYLGRKIQYETGRNYGYSPFYRKTILKSVTIGNSVTSIGEYVFYGCNRLTSVTIGNSVTSIGNYAFCSCNRLTSVTIGNSVTSIGELAFEDCIGLTSITIGNSVTSIGNYAFRGCSGLTSITIGNSVTSIGRSAFIGCSGLTSIYLVGTTPPDVVSDCFTESQYAFTTVYVPQGSLAAYQAADVWKTFWDIQEYDVTAINDVTDDALVFEITANGIQFTAAEGKAVAVYSAGGAQIVNISNYAGEEISLDKGVYILCVGNKTMKVRL